MSIFDFYDDDENANETIELRSSITNNDQNKKEIKSNRRSTLTIENKVPTDALCKECSNQGTNQTMTESIYFNFKLKKKCFFILAVIDAKIFIILLAVFHLYHHSRNDEIMVGHVIDVMMIVIMKHQMELFHQRLNIV